MSKIARALANAATETVAQKIQEASALPMPVSPEAAQHLASQAVQEAASAPAVSAAIQSVLPRPIAWYKSQALWGQFFAFVGAIAFGAPQLVTFFPEWGDEILRWAGLVSFLIGTWNAVSGRVTTTRPIAGTEAAERVKSLARQ